MILLDVLVHRRTRLADDYDRLLYLIDRPNPYPAQGCRYRRGCLKHLDRGLASRTRAGKLQKLFSSYLS
jgi:hypothetical protein